ncbi:LOW QUALITY PROTEIN: DM13 and DOMON_DOH domain-containing protein skeletor [Osmia lignaria lignaria]|uniref:LOW QUALITY PROTEIN: DM13 and DOMON_DOH domain-containing protein skeletor n=1 Tax=Osmia lignaria lignaria TaxID=1437193 RepID=UPI0014790BDD|nr:LOW QUALITY PROTEIN: protein Skeletor, isoforms B/C-like [Osmia lignaria]
MTDLREQAEQKGEARRKRDAEVKQGEPVIVVGSTKLPGSTTATFDGSNHEDAMTAPSPTSSSTRLSTALLVAAVFILLATQVCSGAYYGKLIGKLSELHHGVSGEVYAVDGRTLFVKDFTYDGEAPTAYFYVGNTKTPNGNGIRLRDERGSAETIKRYRRKSITLTLPEGKTLNNIKWFAVWCDEYAVNFGDVRIPRGFDYPKPQKLAALSGVHGVSSEPIVVVDAQTLLIPSFSYDGEAPDAKFWVGAGPTPSPQGIRVPDENGKEVPLRRYDRKAIVLTLPGDLTIHQIGHFGVWCEAFTVDFGHVQIPQNLNVPPSLKMLGVSPQSKLNCEVLEEKLAFEVRWAVAGDSIVAQLVGKLEDGQYMAFGLSADPNRSLMVGGDAVVAWVDKQTLQGYAVDYFLDAKSQCSGGRGSCPDTRIQENTNSIRLLNAALVDGYSIVTYQRALKTNDELDHQILTNGSQAIIWAIGPLNERLEVSFHTDYLKSDRFIDFGRPPVWNCPIPEHSQTLVDNEDKASGNQPVAIVTTRRPQRAPATPAPASKNDAWEIPPIQCYEPDDGVFYAQMGPTGGKHGYPAITGHVGWGISWYINGLLIPVINVVRGTKYTFVVEGGEDPDTPARYHPFYITDDPVGGYQHKTPEEKAKVKIFAGAQRQRGVYRPTGVGRLCNWVPDQNQPPADDFSSFGAYQRTLTLVCDHGDPGIVEWTPDKNTPDTVYYQCFTHRYLGWKINVLDSCDAGETAASENHEVFVQPERQRTNVDLENSPSIRVPSKVTPSAEFLQQHLHQAHDNPRPMSHGTKYTYPAASNPQIQYPNRPLYHHYATNYHHLYHQPPHHHYHHYQPEQRNQLMMIKRPMMTRRPMLQTSHTMPQPSLPLPSRPVFLERKKSVYAPASPVYRRNQEKVSAVNGNVQISKLKKVDPKQWSKVEAKVSDTNAPNLFSTPMKPARNTGFDPGSIVIESGFKPIIRTLEKPTDVAEKRSSDITDEEDARGTTNHRPNDNFGPVFIPSPPVPTVDTVKRSKKKPRLGEVEDMEMAADRMNAYYLPPVPSTITNESPSSPSSEVLITFDGKRLKDSGLARSISGIEEHSKSTLSSDVLSRTPQFGRFKGELPPLIPGEARSQLEKRRPSYKDSLLAETTPIKNTKLTLVMRSKRSPHEGHVHLTNASDTDHLDRHSHNDHHDHQSNSSSLLVSTGETIMANLGYIFLTVVFYYII